MEFYECIAAQTSCQKALKYSKLQIEHHYLSHYTSGVTPLQATTVMGSLHLTTPLQATTVTGRLKLYQLSAHVSKIWCHADIWKQEVA